jgi:hypothetical protein
MEILHLIQILTEHVRIGWDRETVLSYQISPKIFLRHSMPYNAFSPTHCGYQYRSIPFDFPFDFTFQRHISIRISACLRPPPLITNHYPGVQRSTRNLDHHHRPSPPVSRHYIQEWEHCILASAHCSPEFLDMQQASEHPRQLVYMPQECRLPE